MGKSSGPTKEQNKITQQELNLLQGQQAQSNQLFQESNPGFMQAENYYQKLASGDQQQIFSAIAPAVGQINTASEGAAKSIAQNMPRGGVEQLAQANLQQQRAGQVGNLATQAYTSAFPALGALSQGGLGISGNEIANAISAGSVASGSNQAVMQANAAGKGSTLGFAGSLASMGGELGSAAKLAAAPVGL